MELLFQSLEFYRDNSPDELEMKLTTKIDNYIDRDRIYNYKEVEPSPFSIRCWEGEDKKVERSWSDSTLAVQVEIGNLRIFGNWSKNSDYFRIYVSKNNYRNQEIRFTPKQRRYLEERGFELTGPGYAVKSNL